MTPITLAVEGRVDRAVAETLAQNAGFQVTAAHLKSGKSQIDKRLPGYNEAARFHPWFVLRDLDMDQPCAGELIKSLLPNPSGYMCLRIPVHAIESWLLADSEQFLSFFHLPKGTRIQSCDLIEKPKHFTLHLLERSRSKAIREDMIPRTGSGGREGPAYSSQMAQFAREAWRAGIASQQSESLRRAIAALQTLRGKDEPRARKR